MSVLKSRDDLRKMHRACTIVVETLGKLAEAAVPGVTTKELDAIARESIVKAGAKPAFLGYRGYPATLCISVNDEVVHGIPGKRKLKEGDIVGLDLGCVVDGYFGDAARTVGVGRVSEDAAPGRIALGIPQAWLNENRERARAFVAHKVNQGIACYVADFGSDGADLMLLSRPPGGRIMLGRRS